MNRVPNLNRGSAGLAGGGGSLTIGLISCCWTCSGGGGCCCCFGFWEAGGVTVVDIFSCWACWGGGNFYDWGWDDIEKYNGNEQRVRQKNWRKRYNRMNTKIHTLFACCWDATCWDCGCCCSWGEALPFVLVLVGPWLFGNVFPGWLDGGATLGVVLSIYLDLEKIESS